MNESRNNMVFEYLFANRRKDGNRLTDSSTIKSLMLITERFKRLNIYATKESYNYSIVGFEFDDLILIGKRNKDVMITIEDKNDILYFDSIEIQQTLIQSNENQLYLLCTNYIGIYYKNHLYKIGEQYNSNKVNNCVYLKLQTVNSPCMVTGVALNDNGIYCLQLIDFPYINTKYIDTNYYYNEAEVGIINSTFESYQVSNNTDMATFRTIYTHPKNLNINKSLSVKRYDNVCLMYDSNKIDIDNYIVDYNIVGVESAKVFELFQKLYYHMSKVSCDVDIVDSHYYLLFELINECVIDKNTKTINAVFRIERYLNYLIYQYQNYSSNSNPNCFSYDIGILLKMKKFWSILNDNMVEIYNLNRYDVSINCYHTSYFSNYNVLSFIVILSQLALIVLLEFNMLINLSELTRIYKDKIMLLVMFVLYTFISYNQIYNSFLFNTVVKDSINTLAGKMDILANIVIPIIIILLNITLILFNPNFILILLSSILSIVVIQLDDYIVTPGNKRVTVRNFYLKSVINSFKKINEHYFSKKYWLKNTNGYFFLDLGAVSIDKNLNLKVPQIDSSDDKKVNVEYKNIYSTNYLNL